MKYKKRGRRKKKPSLFKRIATKVNSCKKRFGRWFKKLSKPKKIAFVTIVSLLLILIVASCAVLGYINSKLDKVNTEEIKAEDIIINEELDEEVATGYTNFVLFGSDSRSDDVSRNFNSDTIIIASLNNATKEVKLVSVYRDTLLDVKNGNIQKCNSAYARGGAAQAMSMLNQNLDLNIQKYVTVSFSVVTDIVDMLGGIEVDVTDAEARAVNDYINETANVVGKKANHLKSGGTQILDGVQATTYARIRKGVGDDYARAARQRLVIAKIFEKVLQSDLSTINDIIDVVLPQISTNLTNSEIMSYAAGVFGYSIGDSQGFPFESKTATIEKRGSCLYATTLEKNVSQLHEVLFGTVDYQPSSKVCSISNEIAYLVSTSKSTGSSSDEEDVTDEPITDDETTEDPTVGGEVTDDPTTDDGTTGDGTTGDGTTGDGTTGDGTTGGDTTGGDTSGEGTTGGDTSGGTTSGGTTGGDTTGGTTGGDTSGGGTTGGDTSGGSTTGGNTSGGNTTGGDTSGGNTTGGNTSGGSTPGGDTSGGGTPSGDTSGTGSTPVTDTPAE